MFLCTKYGREKGRLKDAGMLSYVFGTAKTVFFIKMTSENDFAKMEKPPAPATTRYLKDKL